MSVTLSSTTATTTSPSSFDLSDASFFGLILSSFRDRHPKTSGVFAADEPYFEHEAIVAAISILFFRTTVYLENQESSILRYFFAVLLAGLAYFRKSYELILAVELFSYAAARLLRSSRIRRIKQEAAETYNNNNNNHKNNADIFVGSTTKDAFIRLFYVALSGVASLMLSHSIVSGLFLKCLIIVAPSPLIKFLYYLFPVAEIYESYRIAGLFAGKPVLNKLLHHLFFVTFHVQVGMGYLGIEFLRREQYRRNQLVRMDVEEEGEEDGDNINEEDHSPVNKTNPENDNNGSTKEKDQPSSSTSLNLTRSSSSASKKRLRSLQKAARFQKSAAPFIFFTATPYMAQIMLFGCLNKYVFLCVQHDLHRTVRLNELFDHDNHWIATATDAPPTSPEAYANSMDAVVSTAYEIVNRKFFSLPKIGMLPHVIMKQPWLVAQVLPFILLSDFIKAGAVAFVTTKIERLQKQINELSSIRSKVEAFDMKNAELLLRSGKDSMRFTQRKWEILTVQIQAREVVTGLMTRSKAFWEFMQRNFVFGVLIDCALASLLAVGKISSADIFVFSRAVEDTVDLILTRSRAEAELARMTTHQEKLVHLNNVWKRSKERIFLPCHLAPSFGPNSLVLRNLHYTRGTASVRADHVELENGVYALTGANGSGKSTLFRVLMSCCTNEKPIDLPSSINLLTPAEPLMEEDDIFRELCCEAESTGAVIGDLEALDSSSLQECENRKPVPRLSVTMPSKFVSEISQNFYWPLYTRPIEYFYEADDFEKLLPKDIDERVWRVATELHALEFMQKSVSAGDDNCTVAEEELEKASVMRIAEQLKEEKEDWFGDLSGGQKSKAELVRKVFLQSRCPGVLLVDETMAPLDPASKSTVMKKLKSFCQDSIVLVIYHTDVTQDKERNGSVTKGDCVPSSGFFDYNIHLDHGLLHVRPTC